MNDILSQLSASICSEYANDTDVVLLFDYDGTLVPIAEHPRLARPPAELLAMLERLTRLPNVHLGIISGRQLQELRELFPIPGLFLAGTSGLELDFRGVFVTHPQAGSAVALLDQVSQQLESLTNQFVGAWLEKKRIGLTLHYRHVSDIEAAQLQMLADAVLSQYRETLSVVNGPRALEITPDLGWSKGTAVRMFLATLPARSRLVIYAGDSENDIDAIHIVSGLGGITISVGNDALAQTEFQPASPGDFTQWLAGLELSLFQTSREELQLSPSDEIPIAVHSHLVASECRSSANAVA